MSRGPDPAAVGAVAVEHLPPILYALEVCAASLEQVDRREEADYYRALARRLADAAGGTAPASPPPAPE